MDINKLKEEQKDLITLINAIDAGHFTDPGQIAWLLRGKTLNCLTELIKEMEKQPNNITQIKWASNYT